MGDVSNVDSEKIMSCTSRMENEVGNVQSGVLAFREAVAKLSSAWTSENKVVFMQSFDKDSDAMAEMVVQMSEICDSLKAMASAYDTSESDIVGKLSNLR